MNNDQFEGSWHKLKGNIQEQWGRLTGNDIDRIDGSKEALIGEIQSRYGKTKAEALKEFEQFIESLK